MRALVQRVTRASVTLGEGSRGRSPEARPRGSIGPGLVIMLAVAQGDTEEDARYLVDKIAHLRIFPDEAHHFQRSVLEIGGELLIVSQFTLYADTRKGRRPSFTQAAPPSQAKALFQRAVELFQSTGLKVVTGVFQEHMLVEIHNDGPVTILVDSSDRHRPRR